MKKIAISLLSLTVTSLIGFGFYSYSPTGISEAQVLDAMNRLHCAEQNKDEEKLKQILADEISWSRYKDQRFLTKEDIVEYIDHAKLHIESIKTLFVSTKIENDKAQVYFTMIETVFFEDDKKSIHHTGDYTYTLERQQNEWKLTAIHLEN